MDKVGEAGMKRKRADHESHQSAKPSTGDHGRAGHAEVDGSLKSEKALRRAAQKAAKRRKLIEAQQQKGGIAAVITPAIASTHPFEVDPRDHAETPFEAYRDIEPLLFRLAQELGRDKSSLRIYDPFFCEGSVKAHLARLGFTTVINENRDFYVDVEAGQLPEGWEKGDAASSARVRPSGIPPHDVIVTNPPFSGDHIQRTLKWIGCTGKPFFLLLPDFTSRKSHYTSFLHRLSAPSSADDDEEEEDGGKGDGEDDALFAAAAAGHGLVRSGGSTPRLPVPVLPGLVSYLGPKDKAYMFAAPGRDMGGLNPLLPGVHLSAASSSSSAPTPRPFHVFAMNFQCVWFMGLGPKEGVHSRVVGWWLKRYGTAASAVLADDVGSLPQLARDPNAKRKEQPKRAWRKKKLRLRKSAAKRAGGGEGGNDVDEDDGEDNEDGERVDEF